MYAAIKFTFWYIVVVTTTTTTTITTTIAPTIVIVIGMIVGIESCSDGSTNFAPGSAS